MSDISCSGMQVQARLLPGLLQHCCCSACAGVQGNLEPPAIAVVHCWMSCRLPGGAAEGSCHQWSTCGCRRSCMAFATTCDIKQYARKCDESDKSVVVYGRSAMLYGGSSAESHILRLQRQTDAVNSRQSHLLAENSTATLQWAMTTTGVSTERLKRTHHILLQQQQQHTGLCSDRNKPGYLECIGVA